MDATDSFDAFEQGRRLFEAALDLPDDERTAFLDRACAADPTLRREVEALLVHHALGASLPANPLPLRRKAARPPEDDALPPGAVLNGEYRIIRTRGVGGMGIVYEAQNLNPGLSAHRKVALKQARPDYRGVFVREIKILSGLDHPHLPKVYDLLHYGDERILVMQYIAGTTLLDELKREGAFAPAQALDWAATILATLRYLHTYDPEGRGPRPDDAPATRTTPTVTHPAPRRAVPPPPAPPRPAPEPVLHQDIKPGNLMLTPDGHLFLMDFGLARSGALHLTTTHGIKGGTPAYAPPEQFDDAAAATVRSDLYALGATLVHLLTGTTPPGAMDRRALAASGRDPLDEALAAWQKRAADRRLARDTARWIGKAMALDPADRWADAATMQAALERLRARHARPPRLPYWSLVGVLLLLIAGLSYAAYDTGAFGDRPDPPARAPDPAAAPLASELSSDSTRAMEDATESATEDATEDLAPTGTASASSDGTPAGTDAGTTAGTDAGTTPGSGTAADDPVPAVVAATFAFRDGNTAGVVFLDGDRLAGRTGVPLAVGPHRVRASRAGHPLRRVTVEYVEGGVPRRLTLTPDGEEVVFHVAPAMDDLRVFLHMD